MQVIRTTRIKKSNQFTHLRWAFPNEILKEGFDWPRFDNERHYRQAYQQEKQKVQD